MRSVRALDVLFTAQSAVNLLSRVVASQSGKLYRVEPRIYTHTQDANVEPSSSPNSNFTNDSMHDTFDGVPPAARTLSNHGETATRISEPLPGEATKPTSNLNPVSIEMSTRHVGVRQRYTKPSSKLFESLEPNSLQQIPPVSTLDPSRSVSHRLSSGPDDDEGFKSSCFKNRAVVPLWRYVLYKQSNSRLTVS